MKAFLDMDGVIADFLGGVSNAHNRPLPYDHPEAMGVWDTEVLWGITPSEFWAPCDGPEFWNTLKKTPEADQIVQGVIDTFGQENVCVLTAPSSSIYCVPGKQAWIKKHYPIFSKRMIFGSAKEFMAGDGKVLIDDRDKNIEEWLKNGGYTIRVPRAWNAEWAFMNSAWRVVRDRLAVYKGYHG